MPVSLVLRPYVQELQAAADTHVKHEAPADSVTIDDGELRELPHARKTKAFAEHCACPTGTGHPGTSGRFDTTSLEEGRASSGQSATEPLGNQAAALCQGWLPIISHV